MKRLKTTPRISSAIKGYGELLKTANQVNRIGETLPRCYALFDFAGLSPESLNRITDEMRLRYPTVLIISPVSVPKDFNTSIYDMRVCTIERCCAGGVKVLYKGISSKIVKELLCMQI